MSERDSFSKELGNALGSRDDRESLQAARQVAGPDQETVSHAQEENAAELQQALEGFVGADLLRKVKDNPEQARQILQLATFGAAQGVDAGELQATIRKVSGREIDFKDAMRHLTVKGLGLPPAADIPGMSAQDVAHIARELDLQGGSAGAAGQDPSTWHAIKNLGKEQGLLGVLKACLGNDLSVPKEVLDRFSHAELLDLLKDVMKSNMPTDNPEFWQDALRLQRSELVEKWKGQAKSPPLKAPPKAKAPKRAAKPKKKLLRPSAASSSAGPALEEELHLIDLPDGRKWRFIYYFYLHGKAREKVYSGKVRVTVLAEDGKTVLSDTTTESTTVEVTYHGPDRRELHREVWYGDKAELEKELKKRGAVLRHPGPHR